MNTVISVVKILSIKKVSALLASIVVIVAFYCLSQITFEKGTKDAKKVVKEYFEYMNNGDEKSGLNLESELRRKTKHVDWENRDVVRLIWIKEGSKLLRTDYMTQGLGKTENPYDVRVFHIVYYEHYKKRTISPEGNGIRFKSIIVTKKLKDSPWLISSIGEG